MEKETKAYTAPELTELGEFTKLTQFGIGGDDPDGGFPDNFPDMFQS
jgi:hypothetical protein